MAPTGAVMYFVAGCVVAVSLALPQVPQVDRLGLAVAAGAGFVAAIGIWALRKWMQPSWFHLTTAAGTLITAACVYWSGNASSPYSFLFLFVAIFAAYFFTPVQVALHLALAGVAYALGQWAAPASGGDAAAHWLLTMVPTALVATVVWRLVNARRVLEAEREKLLEHTIQLARTDPLTGLLNRRAWSDQLDRELARSVRSGEPLCVAMLDLDHFKQFNDVHGHVAGDGLLEKLATAWSAAIRPSDTIARYGGEEFALVLPECDLDRAVEVIERLRELVPMDQRCSAGVACWDGEETPLALVSRADERLYAAKELGRNRLVAAA